MGENNGTVDIVWTQFTGKEHQLWHQSSDDNGLTFTAATMLSTAQSGSDRAFVLHNQGKRYVSWQRFGQGHWLSQL